jgi:hypothetical protein
VTKEILVSLGELFEVTGILLVASPDLVPLATQVAKYVRQETGKPWNTLRRLVYRYVLHRPLPPVVGTGTLTGRGTVSASGFVTRSPPPAGAAIEEHVAFLTGEVRRLQEQHSTLERTLAVGLDDVQQEIADREAAVEVRIATSIGTELARFGTQRIVGTGFLLVGSVLLGLSSFVTT